MGVAIFCNKMEKSRKTRLDGFYDNGKYTEAKIRNRNRLPECRGYKERNGKV
jgi:hypothetical protein